MVNTTDEFWSWTPPGGAALSLQQPWLGITTIGGSRLGVPTLRGQDVEVPYRAGMNWRPKYPNSRTITLVMWTAGISQSTGNPAADQRLAWNDNWLQIRKSFWNRGAQGSKQGTLTRQWFITQGAPAMVSATALAEVAGTMEPTMTGRTRSSFSVDLLLSDPYFYGTVQSPSLSYNVATNVTNLGEGVVGENFGDAFSVRLNGPLTSPVVLTNTTAGVSFTYTNAIANGHYVIFDIVNYTAVSDLAANLIQFVTHAGSRMWMCLLPGVNSLRLTSGNGGDTGTAALSYLTPYL